jgi:hypothetical protein
LISRLPGILLRELLVGDLPWDLSLLSFPGCPLSGLKQAIAPELLNERGPVHIEKACCFGLVPKA